MKKLLIVASLLIGSLSLFSQDAAFRKKEYNLSGALAIKGYDPVAYFTKHKALKGSPDFTAAYNGVNYQFASAEDRDLFKKTPAQYEPQYGGWCAYAMGNDGTKVEIDPETYKIIDGKLFLFYNHFFTNTLKSWNKDEAHLHTNADANWQKLLK